MSSLIDARRLTKIYNVEGVATNALIEANFTIQPGEFVSIMGPSGSGKSTLLNLIGLLDRPTSGQYFFGGEDVADFSDQELTRLRNQKIGFIFQAFHLLPRATVMENVMLPLYYSSVSPREYHHRAQAVLEQIGMSHRLRHLPYQLSGGERQRVAIARALINEPSLVLADEPTGNLDSQNGKMVMDLIDELHEQGHTVIVITHETPTAEYAGRIIKLYDGRIVSDAPAEHTHQHYTK
ncbi:MAG: ABC transporter ATP-binding protein [Candidatus Andersenbacteria bacterium]|nr:ABC transporter ATP-binding protein [bacterium]MDZ4225509.1 ABC transporter ATP-binding protein [Candidatus Andersenbacteria bacterium]